MVECLTSCPLRYAAIHKSGTLKGHCLDAEATQVQGLANSGYCGYVLGSEYFKRFYINFSNCVADEVDQHRRLLPVQIQSIDQSFKVCPCVK